jgi:hypothetical protein
VRPVPIWRAAEGAADPHVDGGFHELCGWHLGLWESAEFEPASWGKTLEGSRNCMPRTTATATATARSTAAAEDAEERGDSKSNCSRGRRGRARTDADNVNFNCLALHLGVEIGVGGLVFSPNQPICAGRDGLSPSQIGSDLVRGGPRLPLPLPLKLPLKLPLPLQSPRSSASVRVHPRLAVDLAGSVAVAGVHPRLAVAVATVSVHPRLPTILTRPPIRPIMSKTLKRDPWP